VLFVCVDNGLSILTPVETRRSWSAAEVARSVGMKAVEITDDPWVVADTVRTLAADLPAFVNIHTVRHLWHAGTGVDGPPEWDRHAMVCDVLTSRGHGEALARIEADACGWAEALWQKPSRR
jgi:hypothetical protein